MEKVRIVVHRRVCQRAARYSFACDRCRLSQQADEYHCEPFCLPLRFFSGTAEFALACVFVVRVLQSEYTGAIWIDRENSRVLRIELSARNMPRAFALDTVESAVDYDYVLIGDSKFLCPCTLKP